MRITAASLAVLCALAACAQAKSTAQRTAPSALRDDAGDIYCKACYTENEPHLLPIRGLNEVQFCDDGYYCDCQKAEKVRCATVLGMHGKFNPDAPNSPCLPTHNCKKWFDDHPDPIAPTSSPPSTATSSAPSGGTSANPPGPTSGSSTIKPPGPTGQPSGSSTKPPGPPGPPPGSSTIKPPGPTGQPSGSSTIKPPGPTGQPSGSSTIKPQPPGPQSSTTMGPSSSTSAKPKPNGASWGQTSTVGLLFLGVVAAVL